MGGKQKNKTDSAQSYTCENCGHTGTRAIRDTFAELRGVHRLTPGNALCEKCRQPIPFDVE